MTRSPVEDRLADALRRLADEVATMPPPRNRRPKTAGRARVVLAVAAVILVAAVVAGAASRSGNDRDDVRVDQPAVTTGPPATTNAGLLEPGAVKPMAPSPLSGRSGAATGWTGHELLIWGGNSPAGDLNDGAAYDVANDSWRPLAPAPLSGRYLGASAWTGDEMLVWGGGRGGTALDDGAAYDPDTDSWRTITTAPIALINPATVWTGSQLIVIGGINSGAVGAAYDVERDEWRIIDRVPGLTPAPRPTAVWAGDHAAFLLAPGADFTSGLVLYDFDPSTHEWTHRGALDHERELEPNSSLGPPTLVWTGSDLLALHPFDRGRSLRYDTAAAGWRELATPDTNTFAGFEAVWTGVEVVFPASDGAAVAFDPYSDSWETRGAVEPARVDASIAWVDGLIAVWGGFQDQADGYLYRPTRLPTSATPAPLPEGPIVPPPPGPPPSLVPVAGPDGGTPGTVDFNAPPATIDGRRTDYRPVEDDDGNLVGYFGPCGYVPLERFDPDANSSSCAPTTSGG